MEKINGDLSDDLVDVEGLCDGTHVVGGHSENWRTFLNTCITLKKNILHSLFCHLYL
jgi:hypothetical protein